MAAVRRAAKEIGIPEGYAEPVYDVFGTSILSTLAFRDWEAVRSSMMYPTESGDSRALGIISLVEEFGVAPERTIYIGDTDHDVRQAKKAGVLSAAVQTGGQARKHLHKIQAEKPHHLLESFAGLRQVI